MGYPRLLTIILTTLVIASCSGKQSFPQADVADGTIAVGKDGYPTEARFATESARESFRRWFVAVSLTLSKTPEHALWHEGNRDCAGFIRFCATEAMKRHDASFMRHYPTPPQVTDHDVRPFYYPNVPVLGERIWRTNEYDGTALTESAVSNSFSAYADAETLLAYNMRQVSRSLDAAMPGDILMFIRKENADFPFHLMIYAGGTNEVVVYHTGPEGGEIRRIAVQTLIEHPDPSWHPTTANPSFAGVYRLLLIS